MYNLEEIKKFIYKYSPEGIIIDTNILIFLLIGSFDLNFIEECGLTKGKFYKKDFELLKKIVSFFKKIIITPQIIAEVSNLSKREIKGEKCFLYFQKIIEILQSTEENYLPLKELFLVDVKVISDYGFTDMALFELSKKSRIPILTDDLRLYNYSKKQIPIIKFEHIRSSEM